MTLHIDTEDSTTSLADGARCTVGRRDCDLTPEDHTLSRAHFVVTSREGSWWLEDLGSTSGTWHNQNQLRGPTPLTDGDEIRAGRTTFRIRID